MHESENPVSKLLSTAKYGVRNVIHDLAWNFGVELREKDQILELSSEVNLDKADALLKAGHKLVIYADVGSKKELAILIGAIVQYMPTSRNIISPLGISHIDAKADRRTKFALRLLKILGIYPSEAVFQNPDMSDEKKQELINKVFNLPGLVIILTAKADPDSNQAEIIEQLNLIADLKNLKPVLIPAAFFHKDRAIEAGIENFHEDFFDKQIAGRPADHNVLKIGEPITFEEAVDEILLQKNKLGVDELANHILEKLRNLLPVPMQSSNILIF
jgi:hypothetical protein